MPTFPRLNKHSKYFLMSIWAAATKSAENAGVDAREHESGESYERAGTLGFRCAGDVANGAPAPYHYRNGEENHKEVQFV